MTLHDTSLIMCTLLTIDNYKYFDMQTVRQGLLFANLPILFSMVRLDQEVFIIYTTGGEKTNIYQCAKQINKKHKRFLFAECLFSSDARYLRKNIQILPKMQN